MVRGRVWLVVVPLLLVGSEVAHTILGLFASDGYQGDELFGGSGGARTLLPLLVVVAVVSVLLGLVATCSGRRPRLSRRVVAVLPLVAFAVQEHVEYLIGRHTLSWAVAGSRTFYLGLALQLPFAALAYLAARLLFVLADVVAARLAAPRRVRLELTLLAPSTGVARSRRGRPLGDARFNRGPPGPISV